jgi:hypothetical protein
MRLTSRILLSIIPFMLLQCKEDKKLTEANRIVKEWVGKTIQFPDITPFCLDNGDVLSPLPRESKNYKILLYVDSAGCTSCRSRLEIWDMYIKGLGEKVDFLFYFFPKTENELLSLLKNFQFNHPVYIDKQDELNKLNKLPTNQFFQCFLLNKENKIISIGNPALNPKIWELYKEQISGEKIK